MKQRILTAVIALAFFVPFVVIGGAPFTIVMFLIATVGLFELLRMRGLSLFSIEGVFTWLALLVLLIPSTWSDAWQQIIILTKLEAVSAIAFLLLAYTVIVKNRFTFDHAAFAIMSALYVGVGFYYFIETRYFGIEYVIYALIVIWSTDTGAYFIGRKFGKHKLWPHISPNKTIEGFFGGIGIAVIFVCLFQWIQPIATSIPLLIIITIVASIVGQLGDLVESAVKRHYGVKDSGTLLPGHGGILDRFDSLLFVLPLLHFLQFIG